jgi:site-specific recombinase XerD
MQIETRNKFDEAIKQWLEGCRSNNTRRCYECTLKQFTEYYWKRPEAMTRDDVRRYVKIMQGRGLKATTINARIGALSSLYSYLVDCKLMDQNPVEIRSLRPKVTSFIDSRALTTADSKKLLVQCDLNSLLGLRDFVLLSGYLILGRRNTEWRTARTCDFEIRDEGYYFRWTGKGKSDLVAVPAQLWDLLTRYVAASGGRGVYDYVFLNRFGKGPMSDKNVNRILHAYAKKAGITGRIRVHDLRHTAAMLRREAGADVEEIRDFLAHSSLAITQVYLHRLEKNLDKRADEVCLNLFKSIV